MAAQGRRRRKYSTIAARRTSGSAAGPEPCLLLYLYFDYVNPLQVLRYGPEWHFATRDPARFFIIAKDQEPIELLLGCGGAPRQDFAF